MAVSHIADSIRTGSNTWIQIVFYVLVYWCTGPTEILSKIAIPAFWSSSSTQSYQERLMEHRKVFESKACMYFTRSGLYCRH